MNRICCVVERSEINNLYSILREKNLPILYKKIEKLKYYIVVYDKYRVMTSTDGIDVINDALIIEKIMAKKQKKNFKIEYLGIE